MTIEKMTTILQLGLEHYDKFRQLQESDPELLQAYVLGQLDQHRGLKKIMLEVGANPLPDYIFQAEKIFAEAAKQSDEQVKAFQEKQQQEDEN